MNSLRILVLILAGVLSSSFLRAAVNVTNNTPCTTLKVMIKQYIFTDGNLGSCPAWEASVAYGATLSITDYFQSWYAPDEWGYPQYHSYEVRYEAQYTYSVAAACPPPPMDVKVSSSNSPTGSSPKYNLSPQSGSATGLYSVWPYETFKVKVMVPGGTQLPADYIQWSGAGAGIAANTPEHNFSWTDPGRRTVTVKVGGVTHNIRVDVPDVGSVSEGGATTQLGVYTVAALAAAASEALDYANNNYPVGPKRDAVRHALWCNLSVSDIFVDLGDVMFFTRAHEYSNKWFDQQQAFNSTMDLWNNSQGAIQSTSWGSINAAGSQIGQFYDSGGLYKWDGNGSEASSEGRLEKSNGGMIY